MSLPALGFIIFLFVLFVIELVFYAYQSIRYPDRAASRKRLRRTVLGAETNEEHDLVKRRVMSDVPFLNRILPYLPGAARMDLLIKRANVTYTLGFFLLCSISLAFAAYLLAQLLIKNPFLQIAIALFLGSLPFLYVRRKKRKRMARFEKQLPEGLELIGRALRAGHAFNTGMKFASEEFEDPLGPEFDETLDEINFGASVADALRNLARRVDCPDLSFFVVSVILQRETGGNLAEIIENLAHLIRERFKFRGKVRTLSAEGRLSAVVLISLPFLVFGVLFITTPQFLTPLIVDPIGKVLTGIAVVFMIIGIIVIKWIVKVEV
jgi:tight adherence protein B